MAVAVMQGRKTVTRRIIDIKHVDHYISGVWKCDVEGWGAGSVFFDGYNGADECDNFTPVRCPYNPGEHVAMLATWAVGPVFDECKPSGIIVRDTFRARVGGSKASRVEFWHAGQGEKPVALGKSRPGRFLPDHLRPLMPVLEIFSVRAERIQNITEDDALREGIERRVSSSDEGTHCYIFGLPEWSENEWEFTARDAFARLIDSVDGAGTWERNPWVWRVEFRRAEQ